MRKIFFVILFTCIAYGNVQNVELLANNITKNDKLIIATGDVLVYSQRYLITADKAFYNDKSGILELFGNVNLIDGVTQNVRSNYAKLNLQNNTGDIKPFFTYNDQKDMWVESESSQSQEKFYITKNALTSSCNVQDPDWKLGFSDGKLNKKTKFLQLRHVFFYIRNVPVFYLPYFAISTDTTRRTGLLIPSVGAVNKSGFFYKQPIYIAEYDNWDLELDPQIMLKRGYGINSTLRFADSQYSSGSVSFGTFYDKSSFAKEENLKNKQHKGYEIKYKNENILEKYLSKDYDDGLWLDFTYLNDIDYLNLKDENKNDYNSLVTSRLNYFLRNENDYIGLYVKYYIDTDKINNDDTLQELPTLHYRHFLDKLYFDKLYYSFDVKYHKYTRKKGIGANQIQADLPVTFYTSFFDELLHVNVSENIFATYIKYDNTTNNTDTLVRNYHFISLHTDLAKSYESFYHVMRFGLDYTIPSYKHGKIDEEFVNIDTQPERITAKIVNFFYDENGKKRVKQSIKQNFNFEKELPRRGELEHFLHVNFTDNIDFQNDISYSYENKRFSKVQTSVNSTFSKYKTNLIHTYQYKANSQKENFITTAFQSEYKKGHTFYTALNYNLAKKYAEFWQLGFKRHKKCWNVSVFYKEDITPKLTSAGSNFVKKRGVYVAFELYPIGGADYDFSTETNINK